MKKVLLIAIAALLLMTSPILAQTPWIHVEVQEGGDDDTQVRVNLPLSVGFASQEWVCTYAPFFGQ